ATASASCRRRSTPPYGVPQLDAALPRIASKAPALIWSPQGPLRRSHSRRTGSTPGGRWLGLPRCLHRAMQVDGDANSTKRIARDEILKTGGREFQVDPETALEDRTSETDLGAGAKANRVV